MDKTIIICGKPVVFRKTAGTMLRYKRQFGRELLPDLLRIYALFPTLKNYVEKEKEKENTESKESEKDEADLAKIEAAKTVLGVETEWMYDIAFIMAQQADPSITDELDWLDSFDDFNIFYVFIQLMPMIKLEQNVSPKNA